MLSKHQRRKAWGILIDDHRLCAHVHIHRGQAWRLKAIQISNVSLRSPKEIIETTLNAYNLHVLTSNLLIQLFSVKRVANYWRISQIPVLVFSCEEKLVWYLLHNSSISFLLHLHIHKGDLRKWFNCLHKVILTKYCVL